MGDDKKITGYVSKVHIVHLMKGCGETITNKMIVNKVICTLTSHFGHIIVVIQESSNLETLKLEDLTGCPNHMAGRREWLADFGESKKSKIKLADNSSLQVEGTCDIVIQGSNNGKAMIKDILYVPGMQCNLLSVGQLVEKGFSVVMKN
ncbi:uncharacterized protein LOC127131097 [Lathyrus oleraceus]|uniref:uncharacterized protein LOC127131097 n=1 Tax=Pisum sativum TaxID=3888 RepID=UPI0021D19E56|nr:uncharacterized protein LOC127131097 [Pisum sativum]